MAEITINDADLQVLKGKIVLMTGGSSGIGLATANLLLSLGATVVNGDLNPPPDLPSQNYTYIPTNVTSWDSLLSLFTKTLSQHKTIDHVFANAGIRPSTDYVNLLTSSAGEPLEPNHLTLDVNLKGCINTSSLALHYFQKQTPPQNGGNYSLVLTCSPSSYARFRAADYGISKHGVLGLLRGLVPVTFPALPIRVNALCPGWTPTALTLQSHYAGVQVNLSSPENNAKAAVLLMADEKRHGHMVLSVGNEYKEVEEAVLLAAMTPEVRGQTLSEDEICAQVIANSMREAAEAETQAQVQAQA
ncbi:NAD(P)-binding protein [Aureobasidium namibiae CBS 147.97]|uniref:NAD(P)-binding protein n=1 Tax=Aureobasidium namibiae CBS 147.97 TaxID=1043004 RepID=A0A074X0W0_9PEZI